MRRRLLLLPTLLFLMGAGLPETGPVPDEKPKTETDAPQVQTPTGTVAVPTPEEKPDDAPKTEATKPEAKPDQPAPQSEKAQPGTEAPKPDDEAADPADQAAAPVLTIEPENPAAYAQCLTDLKAIGTAFEEKPRIDDGKGCGIDKPITVTSILPGIALAPQATLRCEAALELARWTKEAVLPAAKVAVPGDGALTTINQASSYICRLRNNAATGKISEHARGNAIDIASFTFKNGESIAIQPRDEDGTLPGAFQRAVTATGCLYFETVLDPGSDEAHENHLHFDVLQRRGNYRYCR